MSEQSIDDIALLIADKSTFLSAIEMLKSNMTGVPSHIFPHMTIWPLLVNIGNKITPKMKESTLQSVEELFKIADELYALSPEQRSAVKKYQDSIVGAKEARRNREQEKKEPKKIEKPPQQKPRKVELQIKDDPTTPETIARAARQAELFTKHDIAREEAKASLGHHPLRVMGELISAGDAKEVVFGSTDILRIGQVVVVPRSKGGLCYGEILGAVAGQRCFWSPKTTHSDQLVRVKYGKQQKAIPGTLVGRIGAVPNTNPNNMGETIPVSLPSIGDYLNAADIGALQMGPGLLFENGEAVAVPRSFGGFTIGRCEGATSMHCPMDRSHKLQAWKVITEEADDESEARTKVVPPGLLGKILAPWAAKMRVQLGDVITAPTQQIRSFSPQMDVEEKLRERFGDFTPFLDDEDDNPVELASLEEDDGTKQEQTNWAPMLSSEPLFNGMVFGVLSTNNSTSSTNNKP